ncbi:shikimate dehydrogenase family protein [Haliangium ochraceum]|uniref:Shikimate dehydrogenase (NADP(+)) n=1 Tax=Haliangium ochraceum (strain DSM 14365 / JCM 11303 / SMP-2) TaxID=502025 RepID=D0LUE7_HALO1|nr:shikimate dehydrogenase [Haliangium ochraceum]ACY19270.1 shikimate 5-dehydrogenase [Haliangium ochraceum DSM 14365]
MSGAGTVSASTRVGAVIGAPVAHSSSPALHNAAFAAAGVDAVFVAWEVAPADLGAAVAGMRALGVLGASVTVPHKRAIIEHCDRLAAPADVIGAVNCLVFEPRPEGGCEVVGHNTDAGGFIDGLRRDADFDPAGRRAVLLGAGGAARAVHAGLREAGATEVAVVARRPEAVGWTQARPWTADELTALSADCDLLVDCTPLALSAERELQAPAPVPVPALAADAVVASLIYHRTPALLREAAARGLRTMDGAGMLVYQGARAFSLWTGREAPLAAMWSAMRAR